MEDFLRDLVLDCASRAVDVTGQERERITQFRERSRALWDDNETPSTGDVSLPGRSLSEMLDELDESFVMRTIPVSAFAETNCEGGHPDDTIVHIRVLRQLDPLSCGYYCYHNALSCMRALLAPNAEAAVRELELLRCAGTQGFRALKIKDLLLARVREGPGKHFPWTERSVNEGVMERNHMMHVMEAHDECDDLAKFAQRAWPQLQPYGNVPVVLLPDMCVGSLRGGVMQASSLKNLQSIFQTFADAGTASDAPEQAGGQHAPGPARAFFVGALNHWLCLVANRPRVGAPLELLVLDSRTHDMLVKTDDEINEFVKDYYDKKVAAGMHVTARDWRQKMYAQSLIDSKAVVRVFAECLTGRRSFLAYVVGLVLQDLLDSFACFVGPTPISDCITADQAPDDESACNRCVEWIRTVYPAGMLRDGIVNRVSEIGGAFVSPGMQKAILEWHAEVKRLLAPAAVSKTGGKADRFLQQAAELARLISGPDGPSL